jgi:thiol:disulfide interchange protein
MPPAKKKTSIKAQLPKILILFGIVLAVIAISIFKNQKTQPLPAAGETANETAEEQLDRHLEGGEPVFLFAHSNSCQSCIDMMQTVNQVYPEFKDRIALVDVDVYDPANQALLQRARVASIPTQIFIDSTGQGKISIGVMAAEQLEQFLTELAEGN